MKKIATLLAALCLCAGMAAAGTDPWAPSRDALRIEGPPEMAGVVQRWITGFTRLHPGTTVRVDLRGTDVGLGALTTGAADIALAGRDAAPQEIKGFEWIYRYPPTPIDVMGGSLDHPGRSPALAILVHRDNPLRSIDVAQLDRLFNADRQHGRPAAWSTWGQLGLGGAWERRTVHLYMPDAESGTGTYFRRAVLGNTRTLPWGRLTEIEDSTGQGAGRHDAGRRIAQSVSRDVSAIAVAPMSGALPPTVKVLRLSAGEEAELPSLETLTARRYPLGRIVHAYVNAAPAQPLDPTRAHALDSRVADFLRYVLSPDGQSDVEADGSYIRLDSDRASAEVERLH
jgi:phosphate transport system substrate-binding protein